MKSQSIVVILALFINGCTSTPKRNDGVMIPVVVPDTNVPETFGPEAPHKRPLHFILAPGMARGYSSVGLFEVLSKEDIKVSSIWATGMEALLSALYLDSRNMNDLEWKLQFFKAELFEPSKGLLGLFKTELDSVKLRQVLSKIFKDKKIEEFQIPLHVGIYEKSLGKVRFVKEGNLVDLLMAGFSYPGWMKENQFEGKWSYSSSMKEPFPVDEVRLDSPGLVVLFDSFGLQKGYSKNKFDLQLLNSFSEIRKRFEEERQRADLVLYPEVSSYSLIDFAKKNEIRFQGKRSVEAQLSQLRILSEGKPLGASSEEFNSIEEEP
tara:strand:- start:793 stop:1758 length:966 start_codon:yes stop_codon:yes gene_type:complete